MSNIKVFDPTKVNATVPDAPMDWYSYPLDFASLTINVPSQQNLQIDAASDFYLTAITFEATLAAGTTALTAATRIIPGVKLLLTDGGSSRQLMQNPVPLSTIGGDGPWPHRLLYPRLFVRNSTILVQVTPYDASLSTAWNTLRLNFEGFRIYNQ
jgi:hypothetical protein